MRLSPSTLKLAGALGTLTVAGAAAATVAGDQRPTGAPLTPAVVSASGTATVASPAGAAPGLSIPITPVCQPAGAGARGGRGRAAGCRGTGSASSASSPGGGIGPSVVTAPSGQVPVAVSAVS